MKTYEFKFTINEGSDEFWESLSGTGTDAVFRLVSECLECGGFYVGDNCELSLVKFEDK